MPDYSQIIFELDEGFLNSFLEQVNDEIASIETKLMYIHLAKNRDARLDTVLQSIQNIEMLCRVGSLDPLNHFMQIAELTIKNMRSGKLEISAQLIENFMLMIDLLRNVCGDLVKIRVLDVQLLDEFGSRMQEINNTEAGDMDAILNKTQSEYSIRVRNDAVFDAFHKWLIDSPTTSCTVEDNQLSTLYNLADGLEFRFPHWKGRCQKILATCMLINCCIEKPVDERQLTAAVYLHDLGMALLPDSIVYKKEKYDSEDLMLMHDHPTYGFEILNCINEFSHAAQMVQQHHEHYDGSGYPNGYKYSEIVNGAQIIAVADTFYAMTHNRPDRNYHRSVVRSMSEINRQMGTQFDPKVVDAINLVISDLTKLYT